MVEAVVKLAASDLKFLIGARRNGNLKFDVDPKSESFDVHKFLPPLPTPDTHIWSFSWCILCSRLDWYHYGSPVLVKRSEKGKSLELTWKSGLPCEVSLLSDLSLVVFYFF